MNLHDKLIMMILLVKMVVCKDKLMKGNIRGKLFPNTIRKSHVTMIISMTDIYSYMYCIFVQFNTSSYAINLLAV